MKKRSTRRQPKGLRTGGQFAPDGRARPGLELADAGQPESRYIISYPGCEAGRQVGTTEAQQLYLRLLDENPTKAASITLRSADPSDGSEPRFRDDLMVGGLAGTIEWRTKDGTTHRVGGPAVERPSGERMWLQNGVQHRIDGPARILPDGRKFWAIRGRQLSVTEANEHLKVLAEIQAGTLPQLAGPVSYGVMRVDDIAILTAAGYRKFLRNGTRVTTQALPGGQPTMGVTAGYRKLPGGDVQQAVALDDGTIVTLPPQVLQSCSVEADWTPEPRPKWEQNVLDMQATIRRQQHLPEPAPEPAVRHYAQRGGLSMVTLHQGPGRYQGLVKQPDSGGSTGRYAANEEGARRAAEQLCDQGLASIAEEKLCEEVYGITGAQADVAELRIRDEVEARRSP
jgi:hypothetical protein